MLLNVLERPTATEVFRESDPRWRVRPGPRADARPGAPPSALPDVLLFVDTFTRYFEPDNVRSAVAVLSAIGLRVGFPEAAGRPLCCGRTFLNAGLVDEARIEMDRLVGAMMPAVDAGVPVVGLEPSCALTLRDELPALRPGPEATAVAGASRLFAEFLAERGPRGLELAPAGIERVYVHGHCHEKAFGLDGTSLEVLAAVPGLEVVPIEAGCCGMAGSFGYEAEHAELSRRIAGLELLPALREAADEAWIVANGTSCRHQIADLAGRQAVHLARLLEEALPGQAPPPRTARPG